MESATSSASTARRLRTDFLYTWKSLVSLQKKADGSQANRRFSPKIPIWLPLVTSAVARVPVRAVDRLELFQRPPGADGDARERRLGQVAGHLCLLAQPLIQPLEQRPPAGEHDPPIHDVRRQFRGRAIQSFLDCSDDLGQGLLERLPNLLRRQDHGLGQSRNEVPAPNLRL